MKTDTEEELDEAERIAELRRRVRAERLEEAKKRGGHDSVSDV